MTTPDKWLMLKGILARVDLTPSAKLVFAAVLDGFPSESYTCRTAYEEITRRTGIRRSAAAECVRALKAAGLIERAPSGLGWRPAGYPQERDPGESGRPDSVRRGKVGESALPDSVKRGPAPSKPRDSHESGLPDSVKRGAAASKPRDSLESGRPDSAGGGVADLASLESGRPDSALAVGGELAAPESGRPDSGGAIEADLGSAESGRPDSNLAPGWKARVDKAKLAINIDTNPPQENQKNTIKREGNEKNRVSIETQSLDETQNKILISSESTETQHMEAAKKNENQRDSASAAPPDPTRFLPKRSSLFPSRVPRGYERSPGGHLHPIAWDLPEPAPELWDAAF